MTTRTGLRTGRVVRTVKDGSGVRWHVVEPILSAQEVEAERDAIIASLPADDRRVIEAERLADAIARVSGASGPKTAHSADGDAAAAV